MENPAHARFRSANQELRDLLRRIVSLANGTGTVSENELQRVIQRLLNVTPEIGDASRSETLNPELQKHIADYVNNFRALQSAIAKICFVTLARRSQLKINSRNTDELQAWVQTVQQSTD